MKFKWNIFFLIMLFMHQIIISKIFYDHIIYKEETKELFQKIEFDRYKNYYKTYKGYDIWVHN